ncbi:thiaminase II [Avibacterium volantium]|uniref:Aminopyrimidine aminohydrolase n=1 Tax=Avibacterium volantium TaxID=762 RepID=A0A3S4GXT9_AVIVO|nr:thiaminase II [Avibacterium volantium]VEB23671.1 Thiaminase-2 [Avibacterium volantium]
MFTVENLIAQSQPYWDNYIQHSFVQQLATGRLPRQCFQHYLQQDYLYLFQYSRALSLGIFKADNFAEIHTAHQANEVLLKEIQLHIAFCQEWGISEQDLQKVPESTACVAYTRYVLDCGIKGGLAELYTALAPCMLGYAAIGKMLGSQTPTPNNPYQKWIDTYAAPDFQQAAAEFSAMLNGLFENVSAKQQQQLQHIFTTATRMEIDFWQMGLDLS